MIKIYNTLSEEETTDIGILLGKTLKAGDIVALDGDLGAGKTVITRGIAIGMGLDARDVCSPTFTIVNEYDRTPDGAKASPALFHFDTYRLADSDDFIDAGLFEYFERGGVCVIEWSRIIEDILPENAIRIRITADKTGRRIELTR